MKQDKNLFTLIPKVDELLEEDNIEKLLNIMPRKLVVDAIREEIDLLRNNIRNGELKEEEIIKINKNMPKLIIDRANRKNSYKLKRVVNGTDSNPYSIFRSN